MIPALSIPAERAAPPKDLEIRPKHVKAWLETLPLARGPEAARSALAHLVALNRARIDPDDRLQILESYRPIALVLLEELDAVYGKAAVPLVPRAREALTLARDLATQLATGYKVCLSERTGKLLAFGARRQLPLYLVRTAQYLNALLRASYKSYTPVPPGTWRAMHQIFLHAEKEGVAAEPVDADKASVAEVYCEALLLSLTDPYRLVQGECDKVLAQIRAARAPVTLGQSRPETRAGGHFIVPCDTDKPPKPALSANDDTGGPSWRLLDANPIVERLRMKKQAVDTGNVSATMRNAVTPDVLALMGKLLVLWGDPPKRSSRREARPGSVAICVGIRAVGHYVMTQPVLSPEAESEALRKGITMPLAPLPEDDAMQPVPIFEWEIVNQSAGGLKVRRLAPAQALAVGEVIGIKFEDKRGWTIGVVRWLTVFDEGGMEFGLQFLASSARPVFVQPTITSQGAPAKAGLLLRDAEDPESDDMLLVPPNTYSDLREFEVDADGSVSTVRASSLIEKTPRFDLFHVTPS